MGSEEVTAGFTRWNYGGLTQASQEEDEAGYTEFGDQVWLVFLSTSLYLFNYVMLKAGRLGKELIKVRFVG